MLVTFQVTKELSPSQQPSKQATLNHLTHCSPVQQRPSNRSAPLHYQSWSSINHLLTCGDTCLQHHHCGVYSLWSTWGSMTSNPSNIHVSRCFFILYKLSSSCNSAPSQPLQCLPPWVMLSAEGPAQPNPAQ